MAIPHYMAMTAAEIAAAASLPEKAAWMACHFSAYSTGLVNLPDNLPEGSLLILNDRIPIRGHDPSRIADQLLSVLEENRCAGLLMDLQEPGNAETERLAQYLADKLPCPIGISQQYPVQNAAVFLPPAPADMPISQYLAPWQGYKIWLETALNRQAVALTERGAEYRPYRCPEALPIHLEEALHCHYSIELLEKSAIFHIWRTHEDTEALLKDAEQLGAELAVGLYQEFNPAESAE